MKTLRWYLILAQIMVIGCEETDSLDAYLELNLVNNSVQADPVCDNGGCETLDDLTFSLRLDSSDALSENDEVRFLQYRVDYSLTGIDEKVPYFSSPMEMIVHNGSETVVTLQVVGSRQRTFVSDYTTDGDVVGTARLSLAGYDEKDQRIDFEFAFNIQFVDIKTPLVEE